ncbi:hypothetical protein LCGC14_0509680 [marine sediment metagenome]|uniref:Uncharacterized protein n=1 Tax=marine sediment metagenome TaxID=412755 RepID=A0A0F9SK43_9ZZZZ|nr:hypothetical protein [bacterium]
MKGDYAYVIGFTTLAFSYFLGYLWSPDYVKFFTNGFNHLWIVGFGIAVLISMFLIDLYYKNKKYKK